MYFHNTIYIKCPSCRIYIELNPKCNYCHVCGGVFNSLENNDLKDNYT